MKSMNDTWRQRKEFFCFFTCWVRDSDCYSIPIQTRNYSLHSCAWAICGNSVKEEKNNYPTPPSPLSLPTLAFSTPVTQAENSKRELKLISCTVCSVHFSTWSLSFERQQKLSKKQTLNNARSWCCIWQVRQYCDIGKSKVSFFS